MGAPSSWRILTAFISTSGSPAARLCHNVVPTVSTTVSRNVFVPSAQRPPPPFLTCRRELHFEQKADSAFVLSGFHRRLLLSHERELERDGKVVGVEIFAFDKVPKKLPDWWDDEDDEDDEAENGEGNDGDDKEDAFSKTSDASKSSESAGQGVQFASGGGSTLVSDGDDNGGGGGGGGERGGQGGGGSDGADEGDQSGSLFAMVVAFLSSMFAARPIASRAVVTSLLAMIGDTLAQRIAHQQGHSDADGKKRPYEHNVRRTASVGVWGLTFMGPALYTWYTVLNAYFAGTRFAAFRMMVVDQVLFSPVFNTMFMMATGLLEGGRVREVVANCRAKFWQSMIANWSLWPAAQMINFTLVPRALQVLYVNCVALVWNTMLMYISHADGGDHDVDKGDIAGAGAGAVTQ